MNVKKARLPFRMGNFTKKFQNEKFRCRFGVRLMIYFFLLVFVGPYFGNWNTTEKYLCRIDVYARECSLSERLGPATNTFRCAAQRFKIAKLGSICRLCVLTIGFALGLLLDTIGPKFTFLIGMLLRMSSWLIFSLRNASNTLIVFSSVFLGLSRNAIAYPALTIYMYTTNFKEYATTIIGIGITLAGLYIIVIERIMGLTEADPYKFTLYSMLITHIPCLIIGFIVFPWKSPTPKTKKTPKNDSSRTDEQTLQDENKDHYQSNETSSGNLEDLNLETSNDIVSRFDNPEPTLIRVDKSTGRPESEIEFHYDLQAPSQPENAQWNLKQFLKYLTSVEYVVTCPYFVFNFLDFFFMQVMFSTMYGAYPEVITLNEYLVAFSFVLTFLIGLLYKVFSPLTILVLSNVFGIVSHFFAFGDTMFSGVMVASTVIAYASILFTQTYIYIQSTFNPKYFGSLIGTINTLSGLVMLFNIVLISLVQKYDCINYIHTSMIVVRILLEIALILLNVRRRKMTKST